MMTLHECVCRYGRLPQTIIVDGGPEFNSTYFETLVNYYGKVELHKLIHPSYVECNSSDTIQ